MEIINLCQLPVVLRKNDGEMVTFAPSGAVAKVSATYVEDCLIGGISIGHTQYGSVVDLPEEKEGTLYIVSSVVRCALPDRKDLVSPTNTVRDSGGIVVCATALTH